MLSMSSIWYLRLPRRIQIIFPLTTISYVVFIGIDVTEHDIRFVEDNWESPVMCKI